MARRGSPRGAQHPPLKEWLAAEDGARAATRLRRLSYVAREYGPPIAIQVYHGDLAQSFFEEARWAFVNGQFISTVLLCQCFIEASLRSVFGAGGVSGFGVEDEWIEKAGFFELVEKAREHEILGAELAEECHAVRKMRVEYVQGISGTHYLTPNPSRTGTPFREASGHLGRFRPRFATASQLKTQAASTKLAQAQAHPDR